MGTAGDYDNFSFEPFRSNISMETGVRACNYVTKKSSFIENRGESKSIIP